MMLSQVQKELQNLRSTAPADARVIDRFLGRIAAWRHDWTTPSQLLVDLLRMFAQTEFSQPEIRDRVSRLFRSLRPNIDALGGMTMNERLVIFDLADVWDHTPPGDRRPLYAKLEANPERPQGRR